jgi:hypothetical protein
LFEGVRSDDEGGPQGLKPRHVGLNRRPEGLLHPVVQDAFKMPLVQMALVQDAFGSRWLLFKMALVQDGFGSRCLWFKKPWKSLVD